MAKTQKGRDQRQHLQRLYKKIINNTLILAFGHLNLMDLKRKHIKEWGRTQTCSNKRIGSILSPLRTALTEAVEDEMIEHNPLQGWTYTRKEEPTEDHIDPFSKQEQADILEALTGQGRNLIQFAFWSGLRTSEFVTLKWTDIDFKNGVIRVRRARTRAAKKDEATKTYKGRRDVKMLDPARVALMAQKLLERVFNLFNDNEQHGFGEAVRTIRTSINLTAIDQQHRLFAVTSTVPGEGKSSVSSNLALAPGQLGKTLLIDCDLRCPVVGKNFHIKGGSAELVTCWRVLPMSTMRCIN